MVRKKPTIRQAHKQAKAARKGIVVVAAAAHTLPGRTKAAPAHVVSPMARRKR